MSVDGSVGVGRDAASHRDSIGDHFMDVDGKFEGSQRSMTRELSEHPFGADINLDVGDVDLEALGISFDPMDVVEMTPAQTRSSSRACVFHPLSRILC